MNRTIRKRPHFFHLRSHHTDSTREPAIGMRVYSWNMLFSNKRLKKALSFIQSADFDVFCLQEVPEQFLAALQELPYEMTTAREADCRTPNGTIELHQVILSRYPIRTAQPIALPEFEHSSLSRAVRTLMRRFRVKIKGVGNRNNLYADIETPYGPVRIFCLHLPLTHPSMRAQEFELALTHRDSKIPTIVCGDFNVLESPHVTPFNWLFGGSVDDAFLAQRERRHLEERFFAYELVNAHRGRSTHLVSQSQLDHILVPNTFTITDAKVLRRTYGSDHHPLFAVISPRDDA